MEIENLPEAASLVLTALGRLPKRAWHSHERLREAIEGAIEILISLEAHGAAQELIDRLDAFDGDCDFETGDEDCSYGAEDDDVPRRVLLPWGKSPAADLFDLEPNIVAPHWDGNGQLLGPFGETSLRAWRNGLKREREQ